jgi:hypothetical protein
MFGFGMMSMFASCGAQAWVGPRRRAFATRLIFASMGTTRLRLRSRLWHHSRSLREQVCNTFISCNRPRGHLRG